MDNSHPEFTTRPHSIKKSFESGSSDTQRPPISKAALNVRIFNGVWPVVLFPHKRERRILGTGFSTHTEPGLSQFQNLKVKSTLKLQLEMNQ